MRMHPVFSPFFDFLKKRFPAVWVKFRRILLINEVGIPGEIDSETFFPDDVVSEDLDTLTSEERQIYEDLFAAVNGKKRG